MREIKFRGLVINGLANGDKWISADDEFHDVYLNHADKLAYINGHEVEYKSVTQYTGLKDKNGRDIYEGDVLDGSYINPLSDERTEKLYKVVYGNGGFGANMIGSHPFGSTLLRFENKGSTVIGNIYENPELLEGEVNA